MTFYVSPFIPVIVAACYVYWFELGIAMVCYYISVFLHECGHALATWCCGMQIQEFNIREANANVKFSGQLDVSSTAWSTVGIIAAAGPIVNLFLMVLLYLTISMHNNVCFDILLIVNFYLFMQNAVPEKPNDGYLVCRSVYGLLNRMEYSNE